MRIRSWPLLSPLIGFGLIIALVIAIWPGLVTQIFVKSPYAPHGVCILWQPDLLALFALMDSVIGLAYLAISVALGYLVFTLRASLPFRLTFLAFGGFIFFCGLTHFLAVITLWQPLYWLDGATKTLTALASLATAMILPFQIPQVRRLVADARSSEQSQRERDTLYERQQQAVEQLQSALASKERDLLTLLGRLQQSETYFRMALQGSPLSVFLTDLDLRYLWAYNPPAPLTAEAMVGKTDDDLLAGQIAAPIMGLKRRVLASGQEQREDITFINNGQPLSYDLRAMPARSVDGAINGVIGMAVDITSRKQLESRLIQSQKMEGIGRLAGGIAHDFNNLLTVMLGNLELLRDSLPDDSAAQVDLQTVIYAADRASQLTHQLLTFARQQTLAPQVMDLNVLIRGMRPMLERLLGEAIVLQLDLQRDCGPVLIDPLQLEQVLLNLVVNARDAIGQIGQVRVATREADLDQAAASLAGLPAGRYVQMTVHDTGVGIAPELMARLFEPFFSTKAVGKGSGLGLSISYGIVAQHSGAISVQSEPGRGATFSVLLPASPSGLSPTMGAATGQASRGDETLLVVEDEDGVRDLIVRLVRGWGYQALVASNGLEALELLGRTDSPPIDMLLTDVVMPQMTGTALAEQLLSGRPDLPVLFLSGYSEHPSVSALEPLLARPHVALMHKPFVSQALSAQIRALLDG